jgi:hypothetical protein
LGRGGDIGEKALQCRFGHEDTAADPHGWDPAPLDRLVRERSADVQQRRCLLDGVDEAALDGRDRTGGNARGTWCGCRASGCEEDRIAKLLVRRGPVLRVADVHDVVTGWRLAPLGVTHRFFDYVLKNTRPAMPDQSGT